MERYLAGGRWTRSKRYLPYKDIIIGWRLYESPGGARTLMPMIHCNGAECSAHISLMHGLRGNNVRTRLCRTCYHAQETGLLIERTERATPDDSKRPYRQAWYHLRARSLQRGERTHLTYADYIEKFPPGVRCHYCRIRLHRGDPETTTRVSLDRLDSQKGYTEENAVPCCFKCNTIKGAEMREHDMRIYCAIATGKFARASQLMRENAEQIKQFGLRVIVPPYA